MATCYRHPGRETGVSCSNCDRPICTDCMTPTPVGMRCPECSKQKTQIRTLRTPSAVPYFTYTVIAICVLTWFGTQSSEKTFLDGALYGPAVEPGGEYYRLVTAGFLHDGPIHLLFNMWVLWFLGTMLEPELGRLRFGALYFASLLAGSFGALLLSPDKLTVGASGAVFGLMAAAFVMQRARGIDPMQSGIGPIILLNLGITFLPGFNISIGGHLGGLIGGAIAAFAIEHVGARRRTGVALAVGACLIVAAVAVAGAIAVADRPVT